MFFIHERFIQGKFLKKGFKGNYLNKLVKFINIGLKMVDI